MKQVGIRIIELPPSVDAYFTSDTHFNQERTFELSKRDRYFKNLEDMNKHMFDRIQINVGINDRLFHLGDIGEGEAVHNLIKAYPDMTFIFGNYELKKLSEDPAALNNLFGFDMTNNITFALVIKSNIPLETGEYPYFLLVHDPANFEKLKENVYDEIGHDKILYCLFGHIHGRQFIKRFGIDVGVDANNYTPISLKDVIFYINAIHQGYYDDSVFC